VHAYRASTGDKQFLIEDKEMEEVPVDSFPLEATPEVSTPVAEGTSSAFSNPISGFFGGIFMIIVLVLVIILIIVLWVMQGVNAVGSAVAGATKEKFEVIRTGPQPRPEHDPRFAYFPAI